MMYRILVHACVKRRKMVMCGVRTILEILIPSVVNSERHHLSSKNRDSSSKIQSKEWDPSNAKPNQKQNSGRRYERQAVGWKNIGAI